MAERLFLLILDSTLPACGVILAVLAARLLLKKAPKILSYALWAVVLVRLLCPVPLENPVSLVQQRPSLVQNYAPSDPVLPVGGLSQTAGTVQELPPLSAQAAPLPPPSADWPRIAAGVWLAGVIAMAGYSLFSYAKLRRSLAEAVPVGDNLWIADHISTAFVLGLIHPRIYLPSGLSGRERGYILAHERHHIRRGDPIFKLLAFAALCLHWFDPLVWLAFFLVDRDMEMSCDEAVLKQLGTEVRADYAASLLRLSTGRRSLGGAALAFGEGNTKSRIKNLAAWKKPVLWVAVIAALLCAVLGVCLLGERPDRAAVIRVAGIDFFDANTTVGLLTETSRQESIPLTLDKPGDRLPENDYHGINLSKRYAGQPLWRDAEHPENLYVKKPDGEYRLFQAWKLQDPERLSEQEGTAFLQAVRAKLTLDGTVLTLQMPGEWPEVPGLEVSVELTAEYSDRTREILIDRQQGWNPLESMGFDLGEQAAALDAAELTLKVSQLLPYEEEIEAASMSERITAAELRGETPEPPTPVPQSEPLTIRQEGRELTLSLPLEKEMVLSLGLTLPEGVTAQLTEPLEFYQGPPGVAFTKEDGHEAGASWVGELTFHELAADRETIEEAVDPAENRLPMPIMAGVALSNHLMFEDYTVQRSGDTSAVATAEFGAQKLGLTDAAVSDPWVWQDCVLAYDWSISPYFAMLTFEQGRLSVQEMQELTDSLEFHLAVVCEAQRYPGNIVDLENCE